MRSKAPLVLMEQLIMVLVFALACALCLRAFVWSEETSRFYTHRDRAMIQCQNTAEVLKGCHGDFSQAAQLLDGQVQGDVWVRYFDEAWNPAAPETGFFLIRAQRTDSGHPLLGLAELTARDVRQVEDADRLLCSLTIAWQEVS